MWFRDFGAVMFHIYKKFDRDISTQETLKIIEVLEENRQLVRLGDGSFVLREDSYA